jgi:site-specific recombinase XerD
MKQEVSPMDPRESDIERFQQYLQRRAPERRTAINYGSDVRQFAAVCPKAWPEVTMHDIDAFVDQQRHAGLGPATVKRRVAGLKVFFDFLAEEAGDLAWPNPVRFKRHAGRQPQRLPRDLTNEQVAELWAAISSARDRAWFALMLRAGLRVGEVVHLHISDVLTAPNAAQPARLRVWGKGQKERIVLLTADAYAVLQAWLQQRPTREHATVFLNERGQPLTTSGIEWLLQGYGQQIGLSVTPHQLRHTFARQLTEGGMPLASLGQLLGHAQLSTTQIYTAGADPALAQAYQTAMAQLASQPLPAPLPAEPEPPVLTPPLYLAVSPVAPPILPDWEAWAPDLPSGLRQASLAFVQRRWSTWKPQRRRVEALLHLSRLRQFWGWQLTHRPIQAVAELSLADLSAYQQDHSAQGYAPTTINRSLHYVLALAHDLADQDQPIPANLFRLRHLPRPDALPRHLSEGESQQLDIYLQRQLSRSDPLTRLDTACLAILAHTGLRASELIDLQFQDLDRSADRLLVRQGKGSRDRVVYLSKLAHQALAGYLGGVSHLPTAPLLTRPDGRALTYTWLRAHVAAVGLATGVADLTAHRLRHTLATRLLNAGMDITRIQKLLGHAHLSTTLVYARIQNATVEADYRQAMAKIELQQPPLSDTPLLMANWPTQPAVEPADHIFKERTLDNSV